MIAADVKSSHLISVVLCTRDRADLFDKAIASVVAQDFPKEEYEIVVVDNGSSDHTADVARSYAAQANVHYMREERVGLCIARNTGWQAAQAPYVALFDDDAIARPGWLAAIADAFRHSPGTVGVIGGRVDPIWLSPRPSWLADDIAAALTIVDWGADQKLITDLRREWLVGANMAAPRAIIAEVGGFPPVARPGWNQPAFERRRTPSNGDLAARLPVPLCPKHGDRASRTAIAPFASLVHQALLLARRVGRGDGNYRGFPLECTPTEARRQEARAPRRLAETDQGPVFADG